MKDLKNIKKGRKEDMRKTVREKDKRSQMIDIWEKENNR